MRENLNDLLAFVAVGRDRSFTQAAAKLGVSRSALSHALAGLEARLGVRLLTRATRSVSLTRAGERLLQTVGHHIEQIGVELEALAELRDKPAGTIRITATEYAAASALLPKLATLLPHYPDISVEIVIDFGLTDIVAQRYDAGVRWGEQVAKDMVASAVESDLATGRLVRVLEDWCSRSAGYHFYYPSRRQHSAAFALLVEALKYRADRGLATSRR